MKKKKRKIISTILLLLIIILSVFLIYFLVFKNNKDNEIKVIDELNNYGYKLEDRDNALYKDNYNKLKEELVKKEINYEEYAKYISSLFIIDLYTMSNKNSKYDIGGCEFIYPESLKNYKTNVMNTLYKYIGYDKTTKYPTVTNVMVDSVKESNFKLNEEKIDSYEVSLSWDYEKDMGYDNKGIITLVKENNKLYIVLFNTGDNNE